MRILAIETSCDETALTVLEAKGEGNFKVLANEVSSQIQIHKEYGGVYPMLAKREHIKNLPILLEKVLKKSKVKNFDLIAVTSGPGLEPALWTGIVFAQDLAKKWNVPLMPVNHMEGHIISVFGKDKGEFKIPKISYPALSLLVSGGHTELVLVEKFGKYKVVGETLDDAVGEAFDKVARMLGLPYPGGPEISRLAEEIRNSRERNFAQRDGASKAISQQRNMRVESAGISDFKFPRPMLHSKNLDFSYSGLKTSVLYTIQKIKNMDNQTKAKIALEFENAAIEPLIQKTKKAIEKYKVNTLIVGGGVSANKHLQREIKKEIKITSLIPERHLSTDNSIMIGMVGYLKYKRSKGKVPRPSLIKAEGNLRL
jgi:N6-L-threonylcarbamoyladenine synthase